MKAMTYGQGSSANAKRDTVTKYATIAEARQSGILSGPRVFKESLSIYCHPFSL
jgi:hypothetical protein